MASNKFDDYNRQLINSAYKELDQFKEFILKKLTDDLRKKYLGKKVKCKCFDALIDGDKHSFNQELIDIEAHMEQDEDIYITVTFKSNGLFSKKGDSPRKWTLYLISIEEVN